MCAGIADMAVADRQMRSLVASTMPCRWAKPSALSIPSRSSSARIISDATPCVGGGRLNSRTPGRSRRSGARELGPMLAQVGGADRRARAAQIGGDVGGERSAVEIVEARLGEAAEGAGERRDWTGARPSRDTPRHRGNGSAKPGTSASSAKPSRVNCAWLRVTNAPCSGIVDRVAEKPVQIGLMPPASADFERRSPSVDRPGDGIGRKRPARRDG